MCVVCRATRFCDRRGRRVVAFVLFLIIRGINRVMRKEQDSPPPPAPPTKEQVLLTEIRDLLRGRVGVALTSTDPC